MFGAIAGRYDLLNTLLSLGVDRAWRREAAAVAVAPLGEAHGYRCPGRILDVATGTADLAIALKRAAPAAEVVGVDFADEMLAIGRAKAARRGVDVRLESGDGLALPYPDASFDVLTVAYGLRNFSDFRAGLAEFHRVLRPGGRLLVLEFTPPSTGPLGRLVRFYCLGVVPRLGGLISGRPAAYRYLNDSVMAFPPPERLAQLMQEVGFRGVAYRLQAFGISALHVGERSA